MEQRVDAQTRPSRFEIDVTRPTNASVLPLRTSAQTSRTRHASPTLTDGQPSLTPGTSARTPPTTAVVSSVSFHRTIERARSARDASSSARSARKCAAYDPGARGGRAGCSGRAAEDSRVDERAGGGSTCAGQKDAGYVLVGNGSRVGAR